MATVTKIDLKKELKHLYKPATKKVELVEVPEMNFLMVNGKGAPEGSQEFQEAIEVLYGVSYTLKFMLKGQKKGPDYTIMPLEGLWWMAGGGDFDIKRESDWKWTLMIVQPGHITEDDVKEAAAQLKEKKDPQGLKKLRFRGFEEGLSVQIMYIGPYSEEKDTIEKMESYASENGYRFRGKHHEIYLGDPRRTAPEKLKTVLRHPVRK